MGHQKLIAALALVALTSLAAGGSAIAGAGTTGHITVCYNAKTHTARYSGTGKCAPGIQSVVVGRGEVGPRGALGPRGLRGLQGALGANGADGTNGSNGSGGTNGNNGATGPTGTTGASGPTGSTGNTGVNTFHLVVSAPTSVDATVTAQCNAGEVASGGGFAGAATRITRSSPTALGDGWSVTVVSPTSPVTATAICVVGTSS